MTQLSASGPAFAQFTLKAVRSADAEITTLKRAKGVQLDTAERAISRKQKAARARLLTPNDIAWAAATGRSDKIVASYRAQYVELPALERAFQLIVLRRFNLEALADRQKQLGSIQIARQKHKRNVAAFNKSIIGRNRLQQKASDQLRFPLCLRTDVLPGCGLVREIRQRDLKLSRDRRTIKEEAANLDHRAACVASIDRYG